MTQCTARYLARLRPPAARSHGRPIDVTLQTLSRSANKGRVWVAIAAICGLTGGAARRGGVRGLGAVAATSFAVNVVVKPMIGRRRPNIELTPIGRRLTTQPWTRSFPSGHAASAAAFTTGLALDHKILGLVTMPLAGAISYSRVHVGVHHVSDVVAGGVLGAAVAVATQRWWPVRSEEAVTSERSAPAPKLPTGTGLVVFVNPAAGDGLSGYDRLRENLPDATLVETSPPFDVEAELRRARRQPQAVGVMGGDGTVASVVPVALKLGLPLAVFPSGTRNHFARDLGLESFDDVFRALSAGEAVSTDVATVGESAFINTASIGAYPEIVARRDEFHGRFGKWLGGVIATGVVLRRHRPLRLRIDGKTTSVWSLFVGNGRYLPRRPFPIWRPRLDDGLLDVHYVRAGRLSRTRAVLATLAGISQHSGAYHSKLTASLDVASLDGDVEAALDGEPRFSGSAFLFEKRPRSLVAYRPVDS